MLSRVKFGRPVYDGGAHTQDDLHRGLLSSGNCYPVQHRLSLDPSDRRNEPCSLAASITAAAPVDHGPLDDLGSGYFDDASWNPGVPLCIDILFRRR